MVMDAGMLTAAELLERETVMLAGDAAESATVHVEEVPAGMVAGEQASDVSGGGTESVIDVLFAEVASVAETIAV